MAEEEKKVNQELVNYKEHVKQVLTNQYQALAKRLETEPNIIFRYEIKLSLESILNIYKSLFEGE